MMAKNLPKLSWTERKHVLVSNVLYKLIFELNFWNFVGK